jgi:hypothetical protein
VKLSIGHQKVFTLVCGETFPFSGADLVLFDPVPQGLSGDAKFFGYLGDRVFFLRSAHETDSLAAELRRIRRSGPWHFFSFTRIFRDKSLQVHRTVASPSGGFEHAKAIK